MKCFLSLISNTECKECLKDDCRAYDGEHDECYIIQYLKGYIKQQMVSLKMLQISEKLQERLEEGG